MTDFQTGTAITYPDLNIGNFDLEISNGTQWVSLNDHFNYRVGSNTLRQRTQARRRITVTSPVYDGTFEVHSVKENVEETIEVFVLGSSNAQVTENILSLIELFEQMRYNLRLRMDDHREVWLCQSAEWQMDRSHVMAHNIRATLTFSVPRHPNVSYENIL